MHKQKYRLLKRLGLRQKNITRHDLDVCLEKKFFFIHVPKTAGKSLRFSLFGKENGARHCSASRLKKCYPDLWEQFFSFCLVRNPYDRLYSAYRYLMCGGNLQKDDLRFRSRELSTVNGFEQFVCDWLTKDRSYAYTHFIPQYEFVYQNTDCLVDHIGKFENLEREYEFIRGKLGLRHDLQHINRTKQAVETSVSEVYSPVMSRKVHEIYAEDFRLFGYEPLGQ